MTFLSILDTLFIGPIKLIFETIFSFAFQLTGNIVLSIVCLSLVINVLVLPLYMSADRMQARAKQRAQELKPGITHIKKTFKGDERMMMLQTYYKQNHYSPLSALSGTVSLLLQIPFFIAAFQFLSNISVLNGASFGAITNLAEPDGLIVIGSLAINILPIIMTAINIVASLIHTKGSGVMDKVQLFGMALLFLVLLYGAPAGVVLYWTLNNVFSLVKTIFYKLKNPKKVLMYLLSIAGAVLLAVVVIFNLGSIYAKLATLAITIGLQIPLIVHFVKLALSKRIRKPKEPKVYEPKRKLFLTCCCLLAVITGLLIPATYIAASPQEFVFASYYVHPVWFVVSSACYAIGMFLIWFQIFYFLANDKFKVILEKIVCILSIVMLVNYFFFGLKLGNLDAGLQYDSGFSVSIIEYFVNVGVVLAVIALVYFLITKFKKCVISVMIVVIIAMGAMSAVNIGKITSSISSLDLSTLEVEEMPTFELSSTGQNVMVIILDRAMGLTVPYIFNERPELREKFAGFTYYNNIISHGANTNFATPSLLGGYEYTPVEMNKRNDISLAIKQNEANLLMPRVLTEQWEGCDEAYVFNPIYTNYQWTSDLTVFDEYDKITAKNVTNYFTDEDQEKYIVENNHRNFFFFSLMKTMPLFMQYVLYNDGGYHRMNTNDNQGSYSNQATQGLSLGYGLKNSFMKNYNYLTSVDDMMQVTDTNTNRYVSLYNSITHEPMLVDETTYTPNKKVDNTVYDAEHADRFTLGDSSISVTNVEQMKHYQTNVVSFVELGKLFDSMRERGIYDNTRIVIVSDHGYYDGHYSNDLYLNKYNLNVEGYFPLLMVKDFNSITFTTSSQFMTTADVPTIVFDGLVNNPTNPYTGNLITDTEKTAHRQFMVQSPLWNPSDHPGNTFAPTQWVSVEDNIWEKDNWQYHPSVVTLKEHKAP